MGWDLKSNPHLIRLMSPEDQERYGHMVEMVDYFAQKKAIEQFIAPDPRLNTHPPVKRASPEKTEQKSFANHLTNLNEKGAKIVWVWHKMNKRSRATPGTPDFFVGINGHAMWIEFKKDYSCELSPPQETFRLYCQAQRIEWHIVYSAFEAIKLVEDADSLW